jgi:two-component system NarL family sensor kinase
LCVPVFDVPQREVIAFLSLHNKPGGFEEGDIDTAQGIASVASIAIQNSLTHHRVCHNEAELHRLSRRLMTSQDEERRRIAHEMHEHTAQDLVGLTMTLGSLKRSDSKLSLSSRRVLDESLGTIQKIIRETRTLAYNLSDSHLEMIGLRGAILSYSKTFSQMSGINVRVEIPEDMGRLTPDEETSVYRIVQEALTNVHRHSGSKQATIKMHRDAESVVLEIADFGRGISGRDAGKAAGGLGMAGMRERARQHGGSMEIESTPGQGLRIRFQLPAPRIVTALARGAGHS